MKLGVLVKSLAFLVIFGPFGLYSFRPFRESVTIFSRVLVAANPSLGVIKRQRSEKSSVFLSFCAGFAWFHPSFYTEVYSLGRFLHSWLEQKVGQSLSRRSLDTSLVFPAFLRMFQDVSRIWIETPFELLETLGSLDVLLVTGPSTNRIRPPGFLRTAMS